MSLAGLRKVPDLAHALAHSWLKPLFRWESATLLWSHRELYLTLRWIAENLSHITLFLPNSSWILHLFSHPCQIPGCTLTCTNPAGSQVLLSSDRVARKPHHSKAVWSKGGFYVKIVTSKYLSLWKELLTGGLLTLTYFPLSLLQLLWSYTRHLKLKWVSQRRSKKIAFLWWIFFMCTFLK